MLLILPRRARPCGQGWAEQVRTGTRKVAPPGETLVLAPEPFGLTVHAIALFNHCDRPLSVVMRFSFKGGRAQAAFHLPARGTRLVSPDEVGPASDELFGRCERIRIDVLDGPGCASSWFMAHRQVHVFFLEPDFRDELGGVVRGYELSPFDLVQGPFRRHKDPVFPDDHDSQRRVYEGLRARWPASVARRAGEPLPEPLRIPPRLHWIWLDGGRTGRRLGMRHVRRMLSWAEHNPELELNLWTDLPDWRSAWGGASAARGFAERLGRRVRLRGPAEIDALLEGDRRPRRAGLHALLRDAASSAVRSDLLRLLVLERDGGLYCDLNDTECLAPFAPWCERFSLLIGVDFRNCLHNAILGSAPGHPVVEDWLSAPVPGAGELNLDLRASRTVKEYFAHVLRVFGPYTLTQRSRVLLENGLLGPDVLLLPYPYLHNPRPNEPTPLSLAAHHSEMSWVPEQRRLADRLRRAAGRVFARVRGQRS